MCTEKKRVERWEDVKAKKNYDKKFKMSADAKWEKNEAKFFFYFISSDNRLNMQECWLFVSVKKKM